MSVFNACVKAGLLFFFSVMVMAEEADSGQMAGALAVDPLASAGKVVLFLVLVVGLILLLAWLAGKSRALPLGGGHGDQLKTLAVLPLGIKEKVAVVQVGEKQLVLGITPQQINCLAELDEPLSSPDAATQALSFSDLLKKAVRS
ncbi:flagellar biosynthetic protein FliO [Bacterioplanoides sp.]|uniref:flagellar biosynthetic protein FliO n=1 Tax=Bacterioplanoides sp. TaxID=2066072 RepID=UPI003B5BC0C6